MKKNDAHRVEDETGGESSESVGGRNDNVALTQNILSIATYLKATI